MRKTFKYRLYKSKKDKHLVRQIHAAASVWNHCIELTRRYYSLYGKGINIYALQKHLSKIRKKRSDWKLINAQTTQDVCERVIRAYKKFYKEPNAGRPQFKKYKKYSSFTLKQVGWKYKGGNRVRIDKRDYKFVFTRPVEGKIKTITIKRDKVGNLWICFSVEIESRYPLKHEELINPVGMDFGLKTFLTLSDGTQVESPYFYATNHKKLKALSRQFARKNKGSRNWNQTRLEIAKLHQRTSNQRRDFFFKLSHKLCDLYDGIAIEDLNIKAMHTLWGRKISDLSFYKFTLVLEYVCNKRGVQFEKIDRFFASSKTCSKCGSKNTSLSLRERKWVCSCGARHDRDLNAAINIRERAFSHRLGNVRHSKSAIAA